MVEVFKTDVQYSVQAADVISILRNHFPGSKINIDLEDCDKVLRIEAEYLEPATIRALVAEHGFRCDDLE